MVDSIGLTDTLGVCTSPTDYVGRAPFLRSGVLRYGHTFYTGLSGIHTANCPATVTVSYAAAARGTVMILLIDARCQRPERIMSLTQCSTSAPSNLTVTNAANLRFD